jgi:hypothetical protein
MTRNEEIAESPHFKDRKAGLVTFGIIQIIFGGLSALMVPIMIFGVIVLTVRGYSSAAPVKANMMVASVLFYILPAAWFICMGVGSIRARRWARALILVSSCLWLVAGTGAFILMLLFMPDMYNQMATSGQIPQEALRAMRYIMTVFMLVIYVIIPAALVLFYGRKDVKATCEFRDPVVRWTDKCPLPVLAVSLMFAVWAFSMLWMAPYGWVIPFFGVILSGLTGAAVAMVVMLLFAYAAWGTYKLRIGAWWCSVLLIVAWALSAGITFSRVNLLEFYERMNFPEQQLEMMKKLAVPQSSFVALFFGLWVAGLLGYLLYTRRYFVPSSQQQGSR